MVNGREDAKVVAEIAVRREATLHSVGAPITDSRTQAVHFSLTRRCPRCARRVGRRAPTSHESRVTGHFRLGTFLALPDSSQRGLMQVMNGRRRAVLDALG